MKSQVKSSERKRRNSSHLRAMRSFKASSSNTGAASSFFDSRNKDSKYSLRSSALLQDNKVDYLRKLVASTFEGKKGMSLDSPCVIVEEASSYTLVSNSKFMLG